MKRAPVGEILKTFEVTSYPKPILVGADGNILATGKLRGESVMETVGAPSAREALKKRGVVRG